MPHIHEKIDFTAEVFIVHKNKVLLRKHDKYAIWLSVGGHVELDEDPNQAALREAKEEVGLDVELVDNRPNVKRGNGEEYVQLVNPVGMNRHRISPSHEHVTFIYFATSKSDAVIPEKSNDEWKWCDEKDVDGLKDIPADVVFYAKKALLELKEK